MEPSGKTHCGVKVEDHWQRIRKHTLTKESRRRACSILRVWVQRQNWATLRTMCLVKSRYKYLVRKQGSGKVYMSAYKPAYKGSSAASCKAAKSKSTTVESINSNLRPGWNQQH
eukprot:253915-Pelagomonas_calceolata.AAC.1